MQKNSSTKDTPAKRVGQVIKKGKEKFLIRVFLYRNAEGKKIYYSSTVTGTRKDAENHLAEYLQKKKVGILKHIPSDRNFEEFISDYFENISNSNKRNRELDFSKVKLYILPALKHFKLKDISPLHIENLYKDLKQIISKKTGKLLSGTTRTHVHRILYSVFSYAFKRRFIIENPLTEIVPPKADTKEMNTFLPEEVKRLLQAVDCCRSNYTEALCNRIGALFHLAVETGLRPEEYFALKWADIDFGDSANDISPMLQVRRVSIRMHNRGEWWFDEPKTQRSKRSVPLSNELLVRLIEQKQKMEELKTQAKIWNEHDLVFPNNKGEPHFPDSIRKLFKKNLKAAGIDPKRYRLYDLRHTCATLLLRANIHPKIVSERLGHSSISITLDIYSHCVPTMQETATKSISNMLYG